MVFFSLLFPEASPLYTTQPLFSPKMAEDLSIAEILYQNFVAEGPAPGSKQTADRDRPWRSRQRLMSGYSSGLGVLGVGLDKKDHHRKKKTFETQLPYLGGSVLF